MHFDGSLNREGLKDSSDLLEEVRVMAHIKEVAAKQRMACQFNTWVHLRSFRKGGLVLKKVTDTKKKVKLSSN